MIVDHEKTKLACGEYSTHVAGGRWDRTYAIHVGRARQGRAWGRWERVVKHSLTTDSGSTPDASDCLTAAVIKPDCLARREKPAGRMSKHKLRCVPVGLLFKR